MTDTAADFAEYERRLAFALARVAKNVESLVNDRDALRRDLEKTKSELGAVASGAASVTAPEAETAPQVPPASILVEGLQNENKSLSDDLSSAREEIKGLETQIEMAAAEREAALSALEKRLGQRARALTQALSEIERLQAANTELIAANRGLVEAGGRLAQLQINESLRAEVEALRAARAAERAALDEIIGGIEPLLAARDTALREDAAVQKASEQQDTASEETPHG